MPGNAPRNAEELNIVKILIEASFRYISGADLEQSLVQ